MLDEELLKCYNLKHNYRAKYLQNKQKRRNEMRFVVILKQIPDDSIKDEYQDVDQLNDSDKNVIKEALDLRDRLWWNCRRDRIWTIICRRCYERDAYLWN